MFVCYTERRKLDTERVELPRLKCSIKHAATELMEKEYEVLLIFVMCMSSFDTTGTIAHSRGRRRHR